MRVAFVSETTAHHADGDDLDRLDLLAGLLAERGHEVHVCCAQWWEGRPDTFDYEDVTYHAITADPGRRWFSPKAAATLRGIDPDVVHATSRTPGHVYGARWGGLLAGAPVVCEWYDPTTPGTDYAAAPTGTPRAARARGGDALPDREDERPRVRPGRRGRARRPDWHRHGPDSPRGPGRRRRHRRQPAPDENANLESLFLALAEFREYDWNCTVVGDGPARRGYERQASDLRIADRVDFVGDCTVEERVEIFKNAHVYVHTAERTSFACDLLWALACGCVGIVEYHAQSSAHELVETYDRGFRATSDEEIVECLVAAGDLERKAVDETFADYDYDAFVSAYLDTYSDAQADAGLL